MKGLKSIILFKRIKINVKIKGGLNLIIYYFKRTKNIVIPNINGDYLLQVVLRLCFDPQLILFWSNDTQLMEQHRVQLSQAEHKLGG